ncbi:MAG: hypothetical protein PHW18_01735 [Sulfuricurvum sp.]|uniref:type II secretion system protein n=1 Tax=Sulfuricurvum sp. TaxID=2025608 RepID=UPI002624E43D|nr:hypothetical protein [Sulfuricurvum sp.]MDD2828276.1 hypothetical protein [Sulfuricurvum sp.]MDD4949769.1 hypothetical protein [Sulfuricurvum sp.]
MHRKAIALIELIFAIVIMAISVMTIPSMMNIAADSAKRASVDDDVMSRLSGQVMDKFQARWGGEYDINSSRTPPAYISVLSAQADLNCSRTDGVRYYRKNPDANGTDCNITQIPLAIPSTVGNGATEADGNVSKGIEKLNGGTETLAITSTTGENISLSANYRVSYVSASVVQNGNIESATWQLGSSSNMMPDGSLGSNVADRTHLKRVVVRFYDNTLGVDSTLSFFKSNIGGR